MTGTVLRPTRLGLSQTGPPALVGEWIAWLVLLFLGGYVFIRWLAYTARAWAPVGTGGGRQGRRVAGVICCALVPLSFGMGLSYVIHPSDLALAASASPGASGRGAGAYLHRVLAVARDGIPLEYGLHAAAALVLVPLSGRVATRIRKAS